MNGYPPEKVVLGMISSDFNSSNFNTALQTVFNLKNKSKDPISEINVTPFVDVMLVLLIVFMVTAPLLTVGVQVDLPESAADSLPDDQEPLTITINSKGELFIQEHKVSFQKIIPKLLAISKNRLPLGSLKPFLYPATENA